MIPQDFITAWRTEAPWVSDTQVEQDLIITRALVCIFQDAALARSLAFRGGTALYKLYLRPAIRYSEDIDLVQINQESIGTTLDRLRSRLDPWLGEPRRVLKEGRVNLGYRFFCEEQPPRPMRLKVEINSREHFSEMGHVQHPLTVHSRWWNGTAQVTTFALDELLGTKMRALYQRKKGRDLLDLWYALDQGATNPENVVRCFGRYMADQNQSVTRAMFEANLTRKMQDPVFTADISPLLRPGIAWHPQKAFGRVMGELIAKLPGKPWRAAEPS